MSRFKLRRPSPALVIAVIALFVGLGGGAVAATAVTSGALDKKGNLKKNAVKKKNIKKNAVVTKKIKKEAVTGSRLSEGSVSGSKLGSITTVTDSTNIAQDTTGTATATCPEGSKVIGGGLEGSLLTPAAGVIPYIDKKSDNGWMASALALNQPGTLTTYAYCLDGNG